MKKFLTFTLFLSIKSCFLFSQTSDWSTSVASIIYNHCSTCHHEGGIAPFALMSYDDASLNAFSIQADVNVGKMPPWPPDANFSHFMGEKILSDDDITAINSWVDGGMPSGDLAIAPSPPVFNGNSMMTEIDDSVHTAAYTIQEDVDEFRTFVVHSNYTETKYINQIEFITSDPSVVHHVFLYQDTTGMAYQADIDDTLPGFHQNGFTAPCPKAELVSGWVPGTGVISMPPNMGFEIFPGADFALCFHYAPGSSGKIDSMKINLKFCSDPNPRGIKDFRFLYWTVPILLNPPFVIPANEVVTFYEANSTDTDKSLVAIQPHMHLLGKSFKVYMVTSPGDTTNLIYIPQWNFNWQMDYFFPKLIKFPSNAQIIGEGTYDNTQNNPNNPNNPPIDVHAGESTYDEMMGCHLSMLDYLPGDENIILDSALYELPTGMSTAFYDLPLQVFNNPAHEQFGFMTDLKRNQIKWTLLDARGVVVESNTELKVRKGVFAEEVNVTGLTAGLYFFIIQSGDQRAVRKIIVQ